MDDMKQNNLAIKLLGILRSWINEIIPQETKNCIRTKVAIIVSKNADGSYNVILSEDFGEYSELQKKKTDGDLKEADYNTEVNKISIDNLFTIKNEDYKVNDYVIIGYLDNKLTNAFILCKNRKGDI